MAALNLSLASDPERRAELERAVGRYVEARDARGVLPGKGHPGGGPERVKCLHAHVAQQLAGSSNPVGRAVLDELGWTDPTDPCVHPVVGDRGSPRSTESLPAPRSQGAKRAHTHRGM
jgi:hypothetical protein